ncbi:hypothetical protein NW767_013710 [Fusarium falciforme]|nr:hypothetical protein NW767_013710 [Fusarium falciforme]
MAKAGLSASERRWTNILVLWASVQDSSELRDIAGSQQFPLQTYIWDYKLFIEDARLAFMFAKVATLYSVMLTILFGAIFSAGNWADSELLKAS